MNRIPIKFNLRTHTIYLQFSTQKFFFLFSIEFISLNRFLMRDCSTYECARLFCSFFVCVKSFVVCTMVCSPLFIVHKNFHMEPNWNSSSWTKKDISSILLTIVISIPKEKKKKGKAKNKITIWRERIVGPPKLDFDTCFELVSIYCISCLMNENEYCIWFWSDFIHMCETHTNAKNRNALKFYWH